MNFFADNKDYEAAVKRGDSAALIPNRNDIQTIERIPWPDPTPEMLDDPKCIKSWDIAVPEAYVGYSGATGNHVIRILQAIRDTR